MSAASDQIVWAMPFAATWAVPYIVGIMLRTIFTSWKIPLSALFGTAMPRI